MTSEMEALTNLYREVYEDGFFIKEYAGACGVGDLRDLDYICKEADQSRSAMIETLGLGELVDLGYPGIGATRDERIRNAWTAAKTAREKGELPRLVATRTEAGLPVTDPKRLGTF